MEIKVDKDVCRNEIAELREIRSIVDAIAILDIDSIFFQSSGETVESMKGVIQKLYMLKDSISSRMESIATEIENHVERYMELEDRTVKEINK